MNITNIPKMPSQLITTLPDLLQATNFVEEISKGPTAVTYAIWITVLLSVIGVFYGLVFAASGGLSEFLKDKVTFTRKDFVPYSERRRLKIFLIFCLEQRQKTTSRTYPAKSSLIILSTKSSILSLCPFKDDSKMFLGS